MSNESNKNVRLFFSLFLDDFWTPPPPPPINFVHGSYMLDMDIIDHVAAALGPENVLTNLTRSRRALGLLAHPSRSARPRKCLNLT